MHHSVAPAQECRCPSNQVCVSATRLRWPSKLAPLAVPVVTPGAACAARGIGHPLQQSCDRAIGAHLVLFRSFSFRQASERDAMAPVQDTHSAAHSTARRQPLPRCPNAALHGPRRVCWPPVATSETASVPRAQTPLQWTLPLVYPRTAATTRHDVHRRRFVHPSRAARSPGTMCRYNRHRSVHCEARGT